MQKRDQTGGAAPSDGPSAAALVAPYIAALSMVAVSTAAGTLVASHWGNGPVDLLYVPAILVAATVFGLWPALATGFASALAYNFFFTPPFHTFRMDRPGDVVTAIVLFLVASVTSKLAASVREQAELARAHANRNATVAGFARRLLSCSEQVDIAAVASRELARIFDCNVTIVAGLPLPSPLAPEPSGMPLTPGDVATAASVLQSGQPAGRGTPRPFPSDWQFYPISSNDKVVAAAGLARDDDDVAVRADRRELLASLLDQVALALERARLDGEVREFAARGERDRVRSTLLSSIARDLRPPIEAIASGVRALRRTAPGDRSAVMAIGSEASKLDRYLANLLDMESESDQLPLEINGVTIDLAHRRVSRNGTAVHLTPKEYAVLAELAKHPGRVLTHAHLLKSAWGPAQEHQSEYLRVAIRALRQKLERDPARPEMILNEPAVGYRLVI